MPFRQQMLSLVTSLHEGTLDTASGFLGSPPAGRRITFPFQILPPLINLGEIYKIKFLEANLT